MIGKMFALLAVPLGFMAYSSFAKASPKGRPSFEVKGKSGTNWRVERVNQFQQPDGLLTMNDVLASGAIGERVLRYSQLGSAISTRKYVDSPFNAQPTPPRATLLAMAARDFGVVLPPGVAEKVRANGG